MVVHKLKMCTFYFVQISFFFSLFWQILNLDIFKQFSFLYIQTLCYDCSHIEHVHPIFMHIWYYIFECLTLKLLSHLL